MLFFLKVSIFGIELSIAYTVKGLITLVEVPNVMNLGVFGALTIDHGDNTITVEGGVNCILMAIVLSCRL
jgi:hypothetical protein